MLCKLSWLRELDLNQRPSGYEPDELPGCSIPRWCCCVLAYVGRPGGDRLSHVLRHSIIGAGVFHGRVRDGIGCRLPAMATRSSNIRHARGVRVCDGRFWYLCLKAACFTWLASMHDVSLTIGGARLPVAEDCPRAYRAIRTS